MPHKHDLATAAKMLGTGRNRLTADLKRRKILDCNRLPRQQDIDAGRFHVALKQHTGNPLMNNGNGVIYPKTFVTSKGLLWLAKELGVEVVQAHQKQEDAA